MEKVAYYIIDLNSDAKRKLLLDTNSKEGIISFVSEKFKKPLFRLFVRGTEDLINESISSIKLYDYDAEETFKLGDFYLQVEEVGAL
jgi:hypothetical protein